MKKDKIIGYFKNAQEIPVDGVWLKEGQKNLQSFIADNPVRNNNLSRQSIQEGIFKKLILKPMPIAALAILLTLITGGGVVAASQTSLPSDNLYPVKVMTEKIEEAVTFNDLKKIELQTKLATERLEEIDELQIKGTATKEVVENNMQKYQNNLIKAQSYLSKANQSNSLAPAKILAASVNLEKAINDQQGEIEKIEIKSSDEYRQTLIAGRVEALSVANKSLEKIRVEVSKANSVTGMIAVKYDDGGMVVSKNDNQDSEKASDSIKVGSPDRYGCIPSAGYTWCASEKKCLRAWEEKCPVVENKNEKANIDNNKIEQSHPDPIENPVAISEEEAIKIANKFGLKKGLEEWTTKLYWYSGRINNYVWSISNRLSEFGGQTIIIDAQTGQVYQLLDYQKTLPSPFSTQPKPIINPGTINPEPIKPQPEKPEPIKPLPSTCPTYINCMPRIIEEGEKAESCVIPVNCEGITQIVY